MVVSRRVSGRLVQPVLNALSGRAIQQKSSFLTDTLDKKVFSDGLTILDRPREKERAGQSCSMVKEGHVWTGTSL